MLSSQVGDKTEGSNKAVAAECIEHPDYLDEIDGGLKSNDSNLVSDCIEVMTEVSTSDPELIVPYAPDIIPLIKSKTTKTRWEAVHTLANIAILISPLLVSELEYIKSLIENDKSVIVRDYSVDIVGHIAAYSQDIAKKAFPILKMTLDKWGERHAKQVFNGMINVAKLCPEYSSEILGYAEAYKDAKKCTVKKVANKIMKSN